MKAQIIEEKPINLVELKKEIEKIKKRDKEIGFRAKKTEEYLNEFVKLQTKEMEEIKKKLEELKISRLKEEFIVKIIDTLPRSTEELKTLLQGYVISLNQEDMKKVVETVKEYA